MGNTLEALNDMLNKERTKHNVVLAKIQPLMDEQRITEEKIKHYERLISLESDEEHISSPKGDRMQTMKQTTFDFSKIRRSQFPSAKSAMRYLISRIETEYDVNYVDEIFIEKFPNLNFSKHSFHQIMKERVKNGKTMVASKGVGRATSRYLNINVKGSPTVQATS